MHRIGAPVTAVLLIVLAAIVSGCNLSRTTPTPIAVPTATDVPAFLPSDPGAGDLLSATAAVSPNPNCPATPPGWIQYTVEPGDSLGLLSVQTDSTVSELVTGNCLDNPDAIEVGAVIYLPRQPVIDGANS